MAAAAFFDLDNTVVRGSSLFPFAWALVRRGWITPVEAAHFAWLNARFIVTRTESASGRDFVMARALALVAGRPTADVMDLCRQIVPGIMASRINPAVVSRIRRHQAAGDQTWLVTASPRELAAEIAASLGMSGALGTTAATASGRYTGRLTGDVLHGARKADAIAALAAVEGLDLADCSAYSDSMNDLPMLAMVGHATVVNPNTQLAQVARKNGWGLLDARRLTSGVRPARRRAVRRARAGLVR